MTTTRRMVLWLFFLMVASASYAQGQDARSALTSGQISQVQVKEMLEAQKKALDEKLDLAKTSFFALVGLLGLVFTGSALFQGWISHVSKESFLSFANGLKESFLKQADLLSNSIQKAVDGADGDFKRKMEASAATFEQKTRASLISIQTILSTTMQLNEARLRLVRDIADVDEPSIHHPLPTDARNIVQQFLNVVESQKVALLKALSNLSSAAGNDVDRSDEFKLMSGLDWVTEGKAHHYVGDHLKAVGCFKEALKLLDREVDRRETSEPIPSSLSIQRMETLLRLGDSYAGCNDHEAALSTYLRIDTDGLSFGGSGRPNSVTRLKMKTELSKAHALKYLMRFEEGETACRIVQSCGETAFETESAKKDSKSTTTRRCYWESMYEQANLLVGLGRYAEAEPIYRKLLENERDISDLLPATWLRVSYADCVWKRGDGASGIKAYQDALRTEGGTKEAHELNFHMARVHVANCEWERASELFNGIDRNALSFSYPYLVDIFHGYTLTQLSEDSVNAGKQMIAAAVMKKRGELNHPTCTGARACYPTYHLAMGLAMRPEGCDEATGLLIGLKKRYPFVKHWAREASCADFPELKKRDLFRDSVSQS